MDYFLKLNLLAQIKLMNTWRNKL